MPRLSPALAATSPYKKFINYKPRVGKDAIYKVLLPPVLRNEVSSKGDKIKTSICAEELSLMFSCWKANDFLQSKCSKEIEAFNSCNKKYVESQQQKKMDEEKGIYHAVKGRLPSKQVNKLLQRFPQPPHDYK